MSRILILFFIFLNGCTPVKLEQPATYVFSAQSIKPLAKKPTPLILLISPPKAAPGYDSSRIVYVDKAYQLSSFTKHRWADTPSRMLMPLFVQTLQATRHFQATVSAPYMGDADIRLDTELLSLQQDFTQKPSQVRMVLLAQLVNIKTQRVMATQQFSLSENSPHEDPYGGVIATHRILTKLLSQLAAFTVHNTRGLP
ncbi:MAG: ABC-type transport auxiliary lipoprotein family protein [Gammaproteobacteria bacterium]